MKKIILSGYMGSGKSTVAQSLSLKTGLNWFDLDTSIEEKAKSSIKDIFETKGEIYFRKMEHSVLSNLMQSKESFVLSLGGGTPCYSNNLELLKGEGVSTFFLQTSIGNLLARLKTQVDTRPLISKMDDDQRKEFIAKHLFERGIYYNQAQYIINTDDKSPDLVAQEIIGLLV